MAELPEIDVESPDGRIVPLGWVGRVSGMPYLPGGGDHQVESLLAVLKAVDSTGGDVTALVDVGDGVSREVGSLTRNLTAVGLVTNLDRARVAVTPEAEAWMVSQDPRGLLAIFHRHVRLIGELLDLLVEQPRGTAEIHQEAADRYRLIWQTKDQITRRITWLVALGMVERHDSKTWQLTQLGRQSLEQLILGQPAPEPEGQDEPGEVPLPPEPIAALLAALGDAELAARNPILGYVPGAKDGSGIVGAISGLVNACSPQVTKGDLLAHVQKEFGVSESSFGAVLSTLTRSGLVQEIAVGVYAPTQLSLAWLETGDALDLVLLMHARYRFVLEIIPALGKAPQAPALAKLGHEEYGLNRVDTSGIQRRLQLLAAAGLTYQKTTRTHAPTPLGLAVADAYPRERPSAEHASSESRQAGEGSLVSLAQELVEAGLASDDPTRLERLVADAFTVLGFESRHVGGAGRTDVLATVESEDRTLVRIIIDAKAAKSGVVAEGAISFDTLEEHKKQHGAQYVALVGPSFETGRVRARAEKNGVRLITTAELGHVLEHQQRTPMSAAHFLDLVVADPERARAFEERWSRAGWLKKLFAHVMAVLAQERQGADQVTGGALTPDQIYLIVRDEVEPRPQPNEIEQILGLLEHPLVNAVKRTEKGSRGASYRLRDEPSLVAHKLRSLTDALLDSIG